MSTEVSSYNDKLITTVFASTDITEEVNINAELDSTGYLAFGGSYGMMLGSFYTEAYGSYGRSDNVDVYNLGGLIVTQVTESLVIYINTSHQWRKTKGFPILELEIFDNREWKNSLGARYALVPWCDIGYSVGYDKLLSGNEGWKEVENDSITHQDFTVTFKPVWFDTFIRYTTGTHRVRPGEPITKHDSIELGFSKRF
ncbi:hypothetical protein [Moritella sp. Urea-trap-13]|uniref:hypothetical protein n=1 Tax=Moritella sp. Urea-trap-13 TaxID=2058327 RepID=UPI0012FF10B1|nr:hypothetical protein [Moritella sp. Urea-trap-13]